MTVMPSGGSITGAMCRNHPDASAVDRCAGCAEPFCPNCLVEMNGQKYCGACKVMAAQAQPLMYEGGAAIPSKEAKTALICAIVGIFIAALPLGIVAIAVGAKAKKMMAVNPRITGSGMATAGIIIGVIDILLGIFNIVARVNR